MGMIRAYLALQKWALINIALKKHWHDVNTVTLEAIYRRQIRPY